MDLMNRVGKRFFVSLVLLSQIFIFTAISAQDGDGNGVPPGGSLLILLVGLAAIFFVGLTFVIRERMGSSDRVEDGDR